MLQEIFLGEKLRWPEPYRCAVNFVFNYQGAEGLEADSKGRIDAEEYARREYGARVGIWRILRLFEKHGLKATFVTCGALAERYPDTVKAIHAAGHDVAGHGYHHERAWKLTEAEELETIRKTVDVLKGLTGEKINGWRCCFQSHVTPDLGIGQGFIWNSNSFSHDLPYLLKDGDRLIVEIPRQPFGDMFIFQGGKTADPDDALSIWKKSFDTFYKESKLFHTYCQFSLHPFLVGRPGRIEVLDELIQYVKGHEGIWYATTEEVAGRVLECAGMRSTAKVEYGSATVAMK
ncbi:MAG TPA: polysaccharide deacetylase family protein [Candidatus Binatia bacterium]|jgi:peptidoglycan/xylan/chitin deacetylase (PgdA/CDA1 family)